MESQPSFRSSRKRFMLGFIILLIHLSGCGDDKATKPDPGDTTPPAAIQNLAVQIPAGRLVTLTWTAPGDDGDVGQATRYDLRNWGRPITPGNWDSATVIPSTPPPKPGGQTERLDVSSLDDGTWYFALKAADEVPNWSALSNSVATTVADVTPPAAITDLFVATMTAHTADLIWTAPGNDGTTGTAVEYDLRYSLTTITDENWAEASRAGPMPAPSVPGTREEFTVTGLDKDRTYYFAIKTADARPNWSALSNVTWALIRDVLEPARVTDLAVPSATATTATLTWTAPGNDGMVGRATEYDLRYSLTEITEGTWDSATRIPGLPAPDSAGTHEAFLVEGLQRGVLYYFALKTADEVPNWSHMSNVTSAVPDSSSLRRLTTNPNPTRGNGAWAPSWSRDGGRIAFRADWGDGWRSDAYVISSAGGSPVQLTNDPELSCWYLAWSPDGQRIAFSAGPNAIPGPTELWIMNADDGSQVTLLATASGDIRTVAWSPDGSKLAYGAYLDGTGAVSHIYVIPSIGGEATDLTPGESSANSGPTWSPDGSRIAFTSTRSGSYEIWVMSADGSNPVQLTSAGPALSASPVWSPDGSRIAFHSNRSGNNDIWVMSSSGSDPIQLTFDPAIDQQPTWSPDGTRIAFASKRTGLGEIWILQLATPDALRPTGPQGCGLTLVGPP